MTLWTDAVRPDDENVAAQFAARTGAQGNVQEVAGEVQTAFVTASQAGTGPDPVMAAHDWIGNLGQNGAIDPIPMTDEKKALFLPKAIDGSPSATDTVRVRTLGRMVESDRYRPVPPLRLTHPEWSKNATIYQINTRQFTEDGTFRAAEAHHHG